MRWVICAVVVLALAPRAFADDFDVLRGTETVGPATYPLERLLWRRPGRLQRRQRQFQQCDPAAARLQSARTGAGRRRHAVRLAGAGQWHDPAATGFRRLCRLQYAMARSDSWRGSQLHPLAIRRHRDQLRRSRRSRRRPAGNTIFRHRRRQRLAASDRLSAHFARAPGWRSAIFCPTALPASRSAVPTTASPRLVYGQQSRNAAGHSVRPGHHADLRRLLRISNSVSKTNTLLYGFAVGGGVDVALTQNIFLRGEFEYIHFAPFASIHRSQSPARGSAPASNSKRAHVKTHAATAPPVVREHRRLTARRSHSLIPAPGHPSPTRGDYLEG